MKILLTGKNGQVGLALGKTLYDLPGAAELVALDRSRMDLSDLDQVRQVIRQVQPDLIVNAAAYTAVDRAESEPELAMRINCDALAVMAEEAEKLGAAMIHYSTDYVFDGTKSAPYVEDDPTAPLNVYGQTKLAGEQALLQSGVPCVILRTSWVYGMEGKNFLQTILRLARERDQLQIVADQIGAPTWAGSIADATARIVGQAMTASSQPAWWREKAGIYHLTCTGQTSWHGFAQEIVRLALPERALTVLPIGTDDYPLPARRPKNSSLATDKLKAVFQLDLPHWQAALTACLLSTRQE